MISLEGNQRKRGEIQVIIGPMLSGKTTELNLRIQRYKIAQYRCFLIEQAKDSERLIDQTKRKSLETYLELADQYDVIGIDDGHCGYPAILSLISYAERVDKLSAVCVHCSQDAAFTRFRESQVQEDHSSLAKHYEPVCRRCFKLPHQSFTSRSLKSPQESFTPRHPLKENFKENVTPLLEHSTAEIPVVTKPSPLVPNLTITLDPAPVPAQDEAFSPPPLANLKSTVNRTKLFSSP
ncbi:thymidine kinase, cytosolic isoform X2 [Octopus bimaculoides]|uniref:thymidine kinase, cytosolic isoform X2 n=1 Tax=Octopus bimaculoides TaxID=37653 RepID=UPI0022DFD146|nr:thymidine kinase, cytosolic isoform X2 [Octopus bimaculoides]